MPGRVRVQALKSRAASLIAGGEGVAHRIRPKPPKKPPAGRIVRLPHGPDDMVDPRSPQLMSWLNSRPRAERIAVMLALSFVYPRLAAETGWNARIATDRRLLAEHEPDFPAIRAAAAKIVLDLNDLAREA